MISIQCYYLVSIRLLEEANSHDQLNMTDNWLLYDQNIRTMMKLKTKNLTAMNLTD